MNILNRKGVTEDYLLWRPSSTSNLISADAFKTSTQVNTGQARVMNILMQTFTSNFPEIVPTAPAIHPALQEILRALQVRPHIQELLVSSNLLWLLKTKSHCEVVGKRRKKRRKNGVRKRWRGKKKKKVRWGKLLIHCFWDQLLSFPFFFFPLPSYP